MPRPRNPARDAAIIAAYLAHTPRHIIAAQHGIGVSRLDAIVRASGVQRRQPKPCPERLLRDAQIWFAVARGDRREDIAARFCLSRPGIYQAVHSRRPSWYRGVVVDDRDTILAGDASFLAAVLGIAMRRAA